MIILKENGTIFEVDKLCKPKIKKYKCREYKTILSYLDGKIKAEYKNYENELQTNFNDDIIFLFDGEELTTKAINGIATVPFEIVDTGEYKVTTNNVGIDNGVVIINA